MISITGQTTAVDFSAMRANRGSNQPAVTSQWASRKTNTLPVAFSAPLSLALIKPILTGVRTTRTDTGKEAT